MNDLHDEQLALILEMIEKGSFSGSHIEVVTDLKICIKVEMDARKRQGALEFPVDNDAPRAIESHK